MHGIWIHSHRKFKTWCSFIPRHKTIVVHISPHPRRGKGKQDYLLSRNIIIGFTLSSASDSILDHLRCNRFSIKPGFCTIAAHGIRPCCKLSEERRRIYANAVGHLLPIKNSSSSVIATCLRPNAASSSPIVCIIGELLRNWNRNRRGETDQVNESMQSTSATDPGSCHVPARTSCLRESDARGRGRRQRNDRGRGKR